MEELAETDSKYSKIALNLGYRVIGQTWPNPPVGCLIVKNGIIVGTGTTGVGGTPHAEVAAIKQAGEKAYGATAYVSLEPCCHFGKTPPCTEAIIKAGIKRLVCPLVDPDERVSGRGFKILIENGVEVVKFHSHNDEAKNLIEGFIKLKKEKRPFISLKLAMSLNGKIATA